MPLLRADMLSSASDFGDLPQLSGTPHVPNLDSARQNLGRNLSGQTANRDLAGECHYRELAQAQGFFWRDRPVDNACNSDVKEDWSNTRRNFHFANTIPLNLSVLASASPAGGASGYNGMDLIDDDDDDEQLCLACGAIGGHIDTCTELAPVNTVDTPGKPLLLAPLLRKHSVFTDEDVYVHQQYGDMHSTVETGVPNTGESFLLLMPDICLLRIYSFLDITSMLRLSSTCRRMHSLHTSAECWRTVELSGLQFTDQVIAGIGARGCIPMVERIVSGGSIAYETDVSTKGVQVLARYTHNLTMVSLANSRAINDTALQSLAQGCPKLLQLNLKNCRNTTDDGLMAVTRQCRNISSLSLMGCKLLTDRGLGTVASLSQLRHLNLWQCTSWSEPTGFLIFASCPLLETIELRFCKEQVTDAMVEHIAMRCLNLRQLGVAYCNRVTPTALDALMHFSRAHLRVLNVRGCRNISTQEFLHYQQKMPNCSILYDKG